MVTLTTPVCEFGLKAPEFNLLGVDNNFWSLKDCMGEKGLLVMFISNHCPYVKAVQNRLIRDTNELKALGINCVAIMPNDTIEYPEDAFENMQLVSENNNYSFPYLLDDTQDIARAFGAICTPDFFGYNNHYAYSNLPDQKIRLKTSFHRLYVVQQQRITKASNVHG